MSLSDEQIKKFQILYEKRFGVAISRAEACEQGARLVRLVEFLLKPPERETKELNTNHKNHGTGKNN